MIFGFISGIIEIGLLTILLVLLNKQLEIETRISRIVRNRSQISSKENASDIKKPSKNNNNNNNEFTNSNSEELYYVEKLQKVVTIIKKNNDETFVVKSIEDDENKNFIVNKCDLE